MAGGGIKPGITFGATDEYGHRSVENIVTSNDYQATLMHLFGLNSNMLIFPHNGQKQTITAGRKSRIVKEIIA